MTNTHYFKRTVSYDSGLPAKKDVCIFFYILSLIVVLCLHAWLCYPAATCRGYPVIHWFWEHVAFYLGFLGVAVAPAFMNLSDYPRLRKTLLVIFTIIACLLLGVVITNLSSARPHPGSSFGFWGIVRDQWLEVILHAVMSSVIAIPFVFCLESIATTFWDQVKSFIARLFTDWKACQE